MTHREVTVGSDEYDFAPDDAPPVGQRWSAVATAQLVDEITEAPVRAPFVVRVVAPGISAKTGDDGSFALVARPWVRFPPAPGARPQVQTRVSAVGYIDRRVDFTIPFDLRAVAVATATAGASVATLTATAGLFAGQTLLLGLGLGLEFTRIAQLGPGVNEVTLVEPLRFTHAPGDPAVPLTAPALRIVMHRQPVQLVGRVVRNAVASTPPIPVPHASVSVADFWRTHRAVRNRPIVAGVPVGDMTGPAPQRFVVALAQGVLAARPAGAGAASVPLSAAVGDEKQLLAAAASDESSVRLANRVGLIPSSILRIDAGDAEGSELHTVDTLLPAAIPAIEPTTAGLDHPLLGSHAPGARVDRLTIPAGPLLPTPLLDPAERGDRTLFLNALPAATTTGAQISGGGVDDEYHDCSRYSATADAAGYFRLPALHRLAQVRLDVSDGVTTRSFYVEPDYATREQWLDLVIP